MFTAWIALMVIQPMLIASRNLALHRKLGYFGAGVAAAMIVLGNLAAVAAMHGGFRGLGDPYVFYAVPFFAINSFAVTVFFAVRWRNFADTHKRLILLSNSALLGAAIARIPLATIQGGAPFTFIFGPDLIILAGMVYDWRDARARPPRLDLRRRADGGEPDPDDGGDGNRPVASLRRSDGRALAGLDALTGPGAFAIGAAFLYRAPLDRWPSG